MTWSKLTTPNGEPVWVNMGLVVMIATGEYWRCGQQNTRLYTGHIAAAGSLDSVTTEHFSIDVAETPEWILAQTPVRDAPGPIPSTTCTDRT